MGTVFGHEREGITTTTYGSFNHLIRQTDAAGNVVMENTYRNITLPGTGMEMYPGPLVSMKDANGAVTGFGYDAITGELNQITDATGAVTRFEYDAKGYKTAEVDALGNQIARTGDTEIEHLYRVERFDANIGFYDLRARLYNPLNGRFLTQDSFVGFGSDPRSLHKYAYTHADPVNNIDPTGHYSLPEVSAASQVSATINLIGIAIIAYHRAKLESSVQLMLAKVQVKADAPVQRRSKVKGMPVIYFGIDVYAATMHYASAISDGISPVLSKAWAPYPDSWYRWKPECKGKTGTSLGLDCDEYPFKSTDQGGPFNYALGRVSLKPIPSAINQMAGSKLGRFYVECRIQPGAGRSKEWFGVVPLPSAANTEWTCGDER